MDIALFDECQSQIGAEEYKTIVEERNYRIQNGEFFLSVAPSIAIVSLICAICVVILIGIAMMKQNVSKRKFIVILSRTSMDIISSLIIAGIGILANLEAAYFSVTALCLFVCTFGFIHTTLCDAFIILIRQLSHERTTLYKTFLSVKRVALIVFLFWLFSIFYLAMYTPLFFVLFKPYDGCSFYSCQKPLLLIGLIIMGFLLASTVCYYLFVLRCLFISMIKERVNNETQISRQRLKRFLAFGLHISLYAVISVLILVLMILVLQTGFEIDTILRQIDQCRIFEYLEAVNNVQSLCSGVVLLWLVKMTFDSILLFIIEYRRLLPWMKNFGTRRSDDDESESTFSSVQRSESLKWTKNIEEVHCSVTEMEQAISAWGSPKSEHSNIYQNQ